MTVAERLKTALDVFGDPVYAVGRATVNDFPEIGQCFCFSLMTLGESFADDAPQAEKVLVAIDFYCPMTFPAETRKSEVKKALFAAGFTWPSTTESGDSQYRNIVFECEIVDGIVCENG